MSLPAGWKQFFAPDGRPYYVDTSTGVSHWNPPGRPLTPPSHSRPVPSSPPSQPRPASTPIPKTAATILAERLVAEYQPPHTYPNGYTPSLYENPAELAIRTTSPEGDRAFWGQMMDERTARAASDKLRRFCDGLFAMLDERCHPRRTGRLEPCKIRYLYTLGCYPWGEDSNMLQDVAMSPFCMEAFFTGTSVPFEIVRQVPFEHMGMSQQYAKNGFPHVIVSINREGLFQWMQFEMRTDPTGLHRIFQYLIKTQIIVDPATRQRFPPIPRSSMPPGRTLWTDADQARLQAKYNEGIEAFNKQVYKCAEADILKNFSENLQMMNIIRQNNMVLNRPFG